MSEKKPVVAGSEMEIKCLNAFEQKIFLVSLPIFCMFLMDSFFLILAAKLKKLCIYAVEV